ncbi:hypothetical protein E2L06_14475 [Haloterrigena sp. H1]|nr:hypothetical protein E2L06_14475 [Haloterrigena sp. H1]
MSALSDTLFEVLANEHRRRILFALVDLPPSEPPIYLDAPPDVASGDSTANIERQHIHLPKLADYGFIEWHRNLNAVEPGPRFEEYRPVLELLFEYRGESPVLFP